MLKNRQYGLYTFLILMMWDLPDDLHFYGCGKGNLLGTTRKAISLTDNLWIFSQTTNENNLFFITCRKNMYPEKCVNRHSGKMP